MRIALKTPLTQRALYALAIALASWTVSAVCFDHNFEGGITYEFCQYAEIGRNILEGRGYRTAVLLPYVLAYLDGRGIAFDGANLAPVLDRFPAQAYLSAATEALLGKNDGAIAALSATVLALGAAATFAVGSLFFAPLEAALAALFIAFNPSFQRAFVLWGLADFGFLLVVLLASAAVCRLPAPGRDRRLHAAPAGALAGAAWLTRSNFILWLPLFYLALWTSGREGRRARLSWFTAAMLATASPGLIHNLRWYGSINPPDLAAGLANTASQTAASILTYQALTAGDTVAHRLPDLVRNYLAHLSRHLRDLPTWWQMHVLFPFALLGFFWLNRGSATPARRWGRLMIAMLLLQLLVFSAFRYEALASNIRARHFLWFAPAAFLLAAHGAAEAGRRLGLRWAGAACLGLVNLFFFGKYLLSAPVARVHPAGLMVKDWPELKAAAQAAGDRLLVSNLSAPAAWYTRHHAVFLPADPAAIAAIDRRHPVGAILISRLRNAELGSTPAWAKILNTPGDLEKFCRANGFEVARDFGTSTLLRRRGAAGAR